MKIYFYIGSMGHGGAERVVANLATMLSERNHQCTIITSYTGKWEYHVSEDISHISLLDNRNPNFVRNNYALLIELRKYLKHTQPDVLISFMGEPNLRACIASIGLKHKLMLSVRNAPIKEYPGKILGFIANRLFRISDKIVFQTEEAKLWFAPKIQEKGVVIMNSVAKTFYDTPLELERHNIVTTGRLVPQKNHKLLISAFAKVASSFTDDLIIYGSGNPEELMDHANRLGVRKRVHFPGQCHDVPNVLKRSKLYVLSSDYEGMPNGLMEAMAVGVPCISTDCQCGGPRLLFGSELSANLCPVGDIDSMAELIADLISDEERLNIVSMLCRQRAKIFEPSVINNIWESQILKLVK